MIRKTIYLCLLLLSPMVFHAQKALTGVWSGKVSNDSNTVRRDQSFEIALTQYREKVYGYSRTSFIVNDTLYTVLKRVKGKIDGEICEIKDDEIISYNFPGRIDKGIKVTTTFRMNKQDSTWHLDGKWSTNKTKHFYAITGTVQLKEETDPLNSKIFAHLQELNVDKEIELPQTASAPVARPAAQASPTKTGQGESTSRTDKSPASQPVQQKETGKPNGAAPGKATANEAVAETKKQPAITEPIKKTETNKKGEPARETAVFSPKTITPANPVAPLPPAAWVNERLNTMSQEVLFSSDSLQLTLYDNGEVDGDTVSVLLNGDIILSRQMLKASALKTSIPTPAGKDEFLLVLYAENLGKYPPNTGLLIVKDGEEIHQVRFSADLKQNAAIIFRRKPVR